MSCLSMRHSIGKREGLTAGLSRQTCHMPPPHQPQAVQPYDSPVQLSLFSSNLELDL